MLANACERIAESTELQGEMPVGRGLLLLDHIREPIAIKD